jgi:epoxyqueuosine reductase
MILQSEIIKKIALNCGFALCGIAKAESLLTERERFEKALSQNFHAKKAYLERNIDTRFSPELLLDNCKSVVVCCFNYNMQKVERRKEKATLAAQNSKLETQNPKPKTLIAQSAQVKDYHVFMKEKLEALVQNLKVQFGNFSYKTTVDTSTISEKAWAVQAGIGYYGKNGIIQTQFGSFIFLGILLLDKEVDQYDTPNQNLCGNCNKCMIACPTKAITIPYYVDCNRCITHILQYEADFLRVAKYGWRKGCDECQDVCPNNAKAPVNTEAVAMKV